MQRSSIELKSSQYTLTLVMDPSVSFEQIVLDVMEKFHSSARFFKGAQMALEFRGRPLSTEQQARIADAIRQSCGLEIICILEKDEKMEEAQYKAITEVLKKHPQDPPRSPSSSPSPALTEGAETDRAESAHTADVIQGTIRNGQKIISDRSVLILGDVEPLGEVSCSGSIFVAGCALGTLRAGLGKDPHSFAAALVLKPQTLELCGHKSITGIRKKTMDDSYTISPQAAMIEDGRLKMTGISGKTWSHLFEKIHKKAHQTG